MVGRPAGVSRTAVDERCTDDQGIGFLGENRRFRIGLCPPVVGDRVDGVLLVEWTPEATAKNEVGADVDQPRVYVCGSCRNVCRSLDIDPPRVLVVLAVGRVNDALRAEFGYEPQQRVAIADIDAVVRRRRARYLDATRRASSEPR